MTHATNNQYTHSHTVMSDGTIAFKCSTDEVKWPWLSLHPFNPITVQAINYWAASEAGAVRGTLDPDKWTALTQTDWTCGKRGVGHATHGIADPFREEGTPGYRLTFFDSSGSLVYRMRGTGVVFRTRDFEAWREKAKQDQAVALPPTGEFQYAPARTLGVATQDESFLSHLIEGKSASADGLVTKELGFLPRHPYHGGSGDHVNSNQLADIGHQFVHLLLGDAKFAVMGGEMKFNRYLELDRPFNVELAGDGVSENTVSMIVRQVERQCAEVTIRYEIEE